MIAPLVSIFEEQSQNLQDILLWEPYFCNNLCLKIEKIYFGLYFIVGWISRVVITESPGQYMVHHRDAINFSAKILANVK